MTSQALRCLLLAALSSAFLLAQGREHLVYTAEVKPADRESLYFSLDIHHPGRDEVVLVSPWWAPGAYRGATVEPRSGAPAWKGVRDVAAVDGTGRTRRVRRDGDRRWIVDAAGARKVHVTWTYATLSSRPNNRSYFRQDSALLDGPRSWLYVEGRKDLPLHVRFDLPDGWEVATGLDPTFDPRVFTADDYDRLADCPTLLGRFSSWVFEVRGVPHRVVLDTLGAPVRFEAENWVADIRRIVETYVDLWGDVPYNHYTFIFTAGTGGGLEHLTSTTIGCSLNALRRNVRSHVGVTAHEYFHVWNVKRMRPRALGPFDYTGANRTKDLWISEGLTDYYTNVGLLRSGIYDMEAFERTYERAIAGFEANPAHLLVSPEEASWTVWEDQFSRISYYLQGEVLGLALDLLIRDATDNRKSLDDALRLLYARHGGYYRHGPPLPGFLTEELPVLVQEATGVDVSDFWARHVADSEPVPWNDRLGAAGWRLESEASTRSALGNPDWNRDMEGLGLRIEPGDVFHRAGFRDGDRLVAIDGREVDSRGRAGRMLVGLKPGNPFEARVERGGAEIVVSETVEPASVLATCELTVESDAVLVGDLPSGGALVTAGLREGDHVTAIDGTTGSGTELFRRLSSAPVGGHLTLTVRRGGHLSGGGASGEGVSPEIVLTLEVDVEADTIMRVTGFGSVEDPTPRQLHIRGGIAEGHTRPAPSAGE